MTTVPINSRTEVENAKTKIMSNTNVITNRIRGRADAKSGIRQIPGIIEEIRHMELTGIREMNKVNRNCMKIKGTALPGEARGTLKDRATV